MFECLSKMATDKSISTRINDQLRPGMLHFVIFCQILEKIRLKTLLNAEIPPDYYTFC